MADFDLYFANDGSNGLEIRDKPIPDFMSKYLDINNSTYCEFTNNDELYTPITSYIANESKNRDDNHACSSYTIKKKRNVSEATKLLHKFAKLAFSSQNDNDDNNNDNKDNTNDETTDKDKDKDKNKANKDKEDDEEEEMDSTTTSLGLGIYLLHFENTKIIALHQSIGGPSGQRMNFHYSIVLIIPNKKGEINVLKKFVTHIIDDSKKDKSKNIFFHVYRWNADQQWWMHSGKKIARKLDTIILPQSTKDYVINDMKTFLSNKSIEWYFEHGIPYKRSYLFYGVPGSGKTSLIQGLAGKFNKKLCFLQPTSPNMTDDSFRACIQQAPENSIIILEDIDALFEKDRKKKHAQCPLTFSGLLNGLDGVCNPAGQLFILTTNFVDQLDEALIRSGRVDVHIKFPLATDEQLGQMFKLFYPQSNEKYCKLFVDKIRECFPKGVSMATTQQHFITNMMATEDELIEALSDLSSKLNVIDELNEKSKSKKAKEDEKKEKEEFEKKLKEKNDKNKEKKKESTNADKDDDNKDDSKDDTTVTTTLTKEKDATKDNDSNDNKKDKETENTKTEANGTSNDSNSKDQSKGSKKDETAEMRLIE